MSMRYEGAWRRLLAAGGLCLIAVGAVGACGKTGPARGGLMLISSDGPLPLDRLDIDVSNNESGKLLSNRYRVPQEASLPTTVAIVSNGDATAQVKISVTGWEGSVPLDRRDAIVTEIPTDRVVTLTVVLSGRCSDKLTVSTDGSAQSACGDGNTCNGQGNCVSATVAASALPVYHAGDENDAGVSEASPNGGSGGDSGMGAGTTGGASGRSGGGAGTGGNGGGGAGTGGNGGGGAGAGGNNGGGAGTGGTAGTAGAQGNAGAGGSGGLPRGRSAALAGKDGICRQRANWQPRTGWQRRVADFALERANNAVGHYWQVDLSQSYALTKLHVVWEKNALYKFKVEGSTDNLAWITLLDETNATNTNADQTYPLPAAPTARWVRVTVTGLPNSTTWASFFEFQVYGH